MSFEQRLKKAESRVGDLRVEEFCSECLYPRRVTPGILTPDQVGTPCPGCGRDRDTDGLPFGWIPVIILQV